MRIKVWPIARDGEGRSWWAWHEVSDAGQWRKARHEMAEEVPDAGGEQIRKFELDEAQLSECDFLSRFQLARLRGLWCIS